MRKIFATAATGRAALFAGAGMAALAIATPGYAQDTGDTLPDCADLDNDGVCDDSTLTAGEADAAVPQAIIVTGSRIRQPELTSTVPVISFSGDSVYKQADTNLGEALNDLPALRSTFAQSNPGLSLGVTGLNLLDLRGLGTVRTLVLVNGRRHVASDVLNTGVAVDINTIPTDLVERVDVVTGGNSSIYGSDAIAGVVNFVLKDDFEGVTVRAGAGVPEFGKGSNYFVTATAGTNFADNRGNIAISGEYSKQDRVFFSDVPYLRNPRGGFLVQDTDASGSDNVFDSVYVPSLDLRSGTISRRTLIAFPQSTPNAACGGRAIPTGGRAASFGAPYNCNFIFLPDGTLVPQTFDFRQSTSAFGGFIGGNGDTGNEGVQQSFYPMNERYIANLIGRYEFSPALEAFVEAKYARQNVEGSNLGPEFNQGQFITFNDPRAGIRLDNPFLSAQARGVIVEQLLASGNNNGLINVFGPLTADDRAAIADGSYRFQIARSYEDLGARDELFQRDTYRIVGGIRGDFADNYNYELSVNYGKSKQDSLIRGFYNTQRFFLAQDAAIDPATGEIVCRSQIDPDAGFLSPDTSESAADRLAADIAACVPYNPFGFDPVANAAAIDYILTDAAYTAETDQLVFSGFVSGTTADFFELPGGPIGLALGAEYRRETFSQVVDEEISSGLTSFNALQSFEPDPFEVKEAFGEINIPILADRPFFEELSITAAGRVSDYSNATGTVFAYNFGGRYSPVPSVAFRANFARAIRAPNLQETSAPLSQNFAPGFADPCNLSRIGNGTANRRANCEADLGANLTNEDFQTLTTGVYSLETLSGSNPLLEEETSDSLTIGAVFQPAFFPGFSLTVDYYNIEVNNVIASPTPQQVVDQCYDLPDLGNQFCQLFERFEGPGVGPNGEAPGQILDGSLIEAGVNFASRKREGIDVDVSYRAEVAEDTFIASRLIYTHVLTSSNFQDPTNPDFENRILSELGDPADQFNFDFDITIGQLTLGYGAQYIGPQLTSTYENFFPLNGSPPLNADVFDIQEYPEVLYHDLRVGWLTDNELGGPEFEFYVGVDNVLDTKPPLGLTATGAGSAIFEPWGRRYYAGIRADF